MQRTRLDYLRHHTATSGPLVAKRLDLSFIVISEESNSGPKDNKSEALYKHSVFSCLESGMTFH